MGKKFSLILLALIGATSLALGLSACDSDGTVNENDETHTHNYSETVIAATCTEQGYTLYTCSCGASFADNYTVALGHAYVHHEAQAATCTEFGWKEYDFCSRCGYSTHEEIPALSHDYTISWSWNGFTSAKATFTCQNDITHVETRNATVTSKTTEPTCEDTGVTSYIATVTFEDETYTDEKTETIPALSHDYTISWSWNGFTSATATFTCQNDITHVETVNATVTSETTATCTQAGVTTYTATVTFDGKTYTDENTETVAALDHDYVHHEAQAATCTQIGWNEYDTCSRCGYSTYEEIPALGHDNTISWSWNGFTSATATFTCQNDNTHVETVNATITSETTATCTKAGVTTYTATVIFDGKTYTDESSKIVGALGHDWDDNVCSRCGYDAGGTKGLNWTLNSDDTCTVAGIGSSTEANIVIPSVYNGLPVTAVADNAFADCTGITSVTIPDSVTSIGNSAFSGCTSLESLTLPFVGAEKDGTENTHFGYIFGSGSAVFNSYNIPLSLKTVIITGGTTIAETAFRGCGSVESITLPDSVTIIGYGAFMECASLKSIKIPDGVTSIGDSVFLHCTSLESVEFGKGVTSIKSSAFVDCISLTSITIPDGVTSIGSGVFSRCYSLESVIIPDSVTSIGDHAFSNCTSLESIIIPDGVTSIGSNTFFGCRALTNIIIPESVTSIGDCAFQHCDLLTSVYYSGTESQWNTITIGSYNSCLTDATVYYYSESVPALNADGSAIDGNYWHYIDGTPTVWTVPSLEFALSEDGESYSVAGIGTYISTDVIIPATYNDLPVTAVADNAFADCTGITSVTIPDSVTSIGYGAFSGCTSLESITLPFVGAEKDGTENTHFGYIFGSGSAVFNSFNVPSSLKTVVITSGTTIAETAFRGCGSIESITLPDSMTSIGYAAFLECSSLKSFKFPDGVTVIENSMFAMCSSLESVEFGKNVSSINSSAFADCTSLTSITIPDGVTGIGSGVFLHCTSLESVIIPDSVTSIGDSAFQNCTSLESIIIPDGVTSIGSNTFADCSSLTNIIIPESVTSVSFSAFMNCDLLTSVYYCGTESQWNTITIGSYNSCLTDATVYYYSESVPALNADGSAFDGNYWHYDTDGITPVIWTKEN